MNKNFRNETFGFCKDPLWDSNLTWYTTNPDFTVCFHQTVLVYLPVAVLVLLLPLQINHLVKSKDRLVPWTPVNLLRVIFNVILIIIPIVNLIFEIKENSSGHHVFTVHFVASVVKLLGYAMALALQLACLRRGLVTSIALSFYWLIAAVCGAITFRSVVMSPFVVGPFSLIPYQTFVVEFPLILASLIMVCFPDPKPRIISLDDQMERLTPERYASIFSQMIFVWFDPFAWKGSRKTLTYDDLYNLTAENRCSNIVPQWDKWWNKMAEKKRKKKPNSKQKVSILSTLSYVFGPAYALSALYQLGYSVLQFANPQIVNLLIEFVESDEPRWKGYFYTVLICVVTLINTILNSQTFYQEYIVGLRVRSALISAIYRKSVRLSNTGRKEMTVGETINLMAIDTQKFMDLTLYLNSIWASPLQIALAIYFLWQILGPSALAGLAVMVLMVPLNAFVASKMKKYQHAQMKDKDRRTKLMDEILNGIKVLKLYAWELSFEKQVLSIREKEIGALKKSAYLNSFTTFMWTCAPFLVALASFTTFLLSDSSNVLDASTAFVSLTLFNLLRIPLNMIPMLVVFLVQAEVSLKRIDDFMNADELDQSSVIKDTSPATGSNKAIHVQNGQFAWHKETDPILKDISLDIDEGKLIAVVGAVGSGKSSLISAILGEMETMGGHVTTRGKIAYSPQQAWIQNATLQNNILFGKKYKKGLYGRVLEACALLPDLEILPGGDQTEIGEKGINMSGGQKQRISIARAVYNNGDLYLLDDPLSAVDSHVGKHIFDKVIGPNGLLKNKTRILVTHGVGFLPEMDEIVVMKEGKITEKGTYKELLERGGEFSNFLIQYLTEESEHELDDQTESELEELKHELEKTLGKERFDQQMSMAHGKMSTLSDFTSEKGSGLEKKSESKRQRTFSRSTAVTVSEEAETKKKPKPIPKIGTTLIEEERAEEGKVKWTVYLQYIMAIGLLFSIAGILFILGYQAFQVGTNIWLSKWSTDPKGSSDPATRNMYLIVYAVLGIFQSLSIMIGTVFVMIGTLNASSKIHAKMLRNVMRSKMSFFDTTPLGRILNRFSKEVDITDVTIPLNIRLLFVQSFTVLGTMVVICYSNPIFVAVVIPVLIIYYLIQKYYVATARQVKRMESITRSPVYSHFGETISGAPTIRAYQRVESFIEENEKRVDFNQICYYPTFASSRWLSVRLETIGNVIILFASLFATIYRDSTDPGLVGLSLSYALNVTGAMNMLVRMTSEVETNMVSVERIIEYHDTPQEAPFDIPEADPPPEWPQHGVIKFDQYQTRYRDGLELVLKGINCEIQSGEKIGIVGRTGAGKSSLTLALFRIIEAAGGSIYIDGENIGFLGLGKLRSRLTIIPQDPVLFSGSMRLNLDPFGQYSDREIWRALEHAHLRSYVSNLPGGLYFEVNESGENLSVGQRQLVCLARALLRKTQVLILDEATAAVDLETDDLIQATIRKEFIECTVLTIAHRLNTIMDSSRVMVLRDGQVVEFDAPEKLLDNQKSVFYSMAKDAGLVN